MQTFDLAVAYKWIYDKELTELIEKMFLENGLSLFIIGIYNYMEVTNAVKNGELCFRVFLDRASDEDENFEELAKLLSNSDTCIINRYDIVEEAIDKHKMHRLLLEDNFPLPFTLIIPPLDKTTEVQISDEELNKLGNPFVVKPSYYSGGAEGVIADATGPKQIDIARSQNPDDYYLLQTKIYPKYHNNHRVWVRAYWFFDEVFLLWWDDQTHIYSELSQDDFDALNLERVVEYTKRIAEISKMDYFSTEATIDRHDDLYIIDYVNDQCDMRMNPQHNDGVPQILVETFIRKMIEKVRRI